MEPTETESREQLLESRDAERRARKAAVADVARLQEREAELIIRLAEYENGLIPTRLSTPAPQVSEPEATAEENQILRENLERFHAAEERRDVLAKVTVPDDGWDDTAHLVRMSLSPAEMRGVLALWALLGERLDGFDISFVSAENEDAIKPDGVTNRFVRSHVAIEKLGEAARHADRLPEGLRAILTECEGDVLALLFELRRGGSPWGDALCRLERRLDFLIDEGRSSRPVEGA